MINTTSINIIYNKQAYSIEELIPKLILEEYLFYLNLRFRKIKPILKMYLRKCKKLQFLIAKIRFYGKTIKRIIKTLKLRFVERKRNPGRIKLYFNFSGIYKIMITPGVTRIKNKNIKKKENLRLWAVSKYSYKFA